MSVRRPRRPVPSRAIEAGSGATNRAVSGRPLNVVIGVPSGSVAMSKSNGWEKNRSRKIAPSNTDDWKKPA